VHRAVPTRGAVVVRDTMDGHRPAVWLSDRYGAQQNHADRQQTCLAHLARDVADALDASDDPLPLRLKLWLHKAFALFDEMASLAGSTIANKRRALERGLADILAAAPACDLARALRAKFERARDQLLTFADWNRLVDGRPGLRLRHSDPRQHPRYGRHRREVSGQRVGGQRRSGRQAEGRRSHRGRGPWCACMPKA